MIKIKKVWIFLIIFVFGIVKNSYCQQEIYAINNRYLNYSFTFEPLSDYEVLDYFFEHFIINGEEYTLQIYALNTVTMHKRLIGYWDVQYGFYQFSLDRKKCVFLMPSKTWYKSIFVVDGRNGFVDYLVDINVPMMTSSDMNFVLFKKYSAENSENIELILLDLRNLNTRNIVLNFNHRLGGGIRIFRGVNKEYDFRIDYYVERSLYGVCTYTIDSNQLVFVFDDTYLTTERFLPREEIVPAELGLY
jgi:hypothetical protein